MNINGPNNYPRRILVAVTGLNPQIITETLYALALAPGDRETFVPTEIHLITTREGAERAKLTLLSENPGWLKKLLADYNLPQINFDTNNIHVLKNEDNQDLDDIRTPEDNEHAANLITEVIRQFTADENSALHVSLAGGRKTMGFYLGYALSLFGREQDRLSHVLVSQRFEGHPDFYYPTPYSNVIYLDREEKRPLDTREAVVTLANIPFVSMRHGLTEKLLEGQNTFKECVEAAQFNLGPDELIIDLEGKKVSCGGVIIPLPPVQIAMYSWFARRAIDGKPPKKSPYDEGYSEEDRDEFLDELEIVKEEKYDRKNLDNSGYDRTVRGLKPGMQRTFFNQHMSNLEKTLLEHLKTEKNLATYKIHSTGKRPKEYYLALEPGKIKYASLEKQ